jgi:hypothetical protein
MHRRQLSRSLQEAAAALLRVPLTQLPPGCRPGVVEALARELRALMGDSCTVTQAQMEHSLKKISQVLTLPAATLAQRIRRLAAKVEREPGELLGRYLRQPQVLALAADTLLGRVDELLAWTGPCNRQLVLRAAFMNPAMLARCAPPLPLQVGSGASLYVSTGSDANGSCCSSARRPHSFVRARLGLLQQLCGLDRQAALEKFLHVPMCFSLSEESISQAVAGLRQMLAGSRWADEQLVASLPTLLSEPGLARLPAGWTARLVASPALPFHSTAPAEHQLLTACRWGRHLLCRRQRGEPQEALPGAVRGSSQPPRLGGAVGQLQASHDFLASHLWRCEAGEAGAADRAGPAGQLQHVHCGEDGRRAVAPGAAEAGKAAGGGWRRRRRRQPGARQAGAAAAGGQGGGLATS